MVSKMSVSCVPGRSCTSTHLAPSFIKDTAQECSFVVEVSLTSMALGLSISVCTTIGGGLPVGRLLFVGVQWIVRRSGFGGMVAFGEAGAGMWEVEE